MRLKRSLFSIVACHHNILAFADSTSSHSVTFVKASHPGSGSSTTVGIPPGSNSIPIVTQTVQVSVTVGGGGNPTDSAASVSEGTGGSYTYSSTTGSTVPIGDATSTPSKAPGTTVGSGGTNSVPIVTVQVTVTVDGSGGNPTGSGAPPPGSTVPVSLPDGSGGGNSPGTGAPASLPSGSTVPDGSTIVNGTPVTINPATVAPSLPPGSSLPASGPPASLSNVPRPTTPSPPGITAPSPTTITTTIITTIVETQTITDSNGQTTTVTAVVTTVLTTTIATVLFPPQTPFPSSSPFPSSPPQTSSHPSSSSPSPVLPPGFQSLLTTTLTSLPPGASIETLPPSEATGFTACTVIGTFSPGASTATVVPVIVIPSAEPTTSSGGGGGGGGQRVVVCWGCVPSWPADLEINLPEFCIDIVGIKIGLCGIGGSGGGGGGGGGTGPPGGGGGTSGGGGGGGGDGGNDGDGKPTTEPNNQPTSQPTNKPSSQSKKSQTSSTTSSSSSSSCTTTITATYESVFCSVTSTLSTTASGEQSSPSCSTLAYTTVTGCDVSVTSSVTTTTETTTATPRPLCRHRVCGAGETCSTSKDVNGVVIKNINFAPNRQTDPERGSWPGPENYGGDADAFMRGESAYAARDSGHSVALNVPSLATYNFFTFDQKPEQMVVTGMNGCTSVVAVSRSGAWLSHFYEVPLFTEKWRLPGDPNEQFDRWVLTALQIGVQGIPTAPYINDTPLGELREDMATISSPWGHLMDDEEQPKLFVITPRERVKKDDGTFDDSPDAGSDDVLAYPYEVYQIVAKLESMFPNSPVVTKGYNRLDTGDEFEDGDPEFNTARGKVMVQYMPAPEAECGDDGTPTNVGKAKYRIWLEGKVIAEEEWDAAPFVQQFDPAIDNGSDASDDTIRPPGAGSDSPRAGSGSPPAAGGGGSPAQPQRRAACSRRSSSAGTSPTASVTPSNTAQSVTARPSSGASPSPTTSLSPTSWSFSSTQTIWAFSSTQTLVVTIPSPSGPSPSPSPTNPGGVKCHFDFYRLVRTENQTVFTYPHIKHTIYRDDRPGFKDTYESQSGWNWSLPIVFPQAELPLPMTVKLEAPVATPSPGNYDPATWKVDLQYGSWGFVADYASQGDCVVVENEENPADVRNKKFECKFNCDGSV